MNELLARNAAARVELPDFTGPTRCAVKRLTGLDLNVDNLDSELSLRGYGRSEIVFVVVREAAEVLAAEYQQLIEQANRCQSQHVQYYLYLAAMRGRAVARVNDRIALILANRLPAVPVWTIEARQKLDLTDKLLPATRGYKLTACPQNKRPVETQLGAGPLTLLEPGGELVVPPGDEPLFVSGAGQTIRWQRIAPAVRSGNLADAFVMVANLVKSQRPKASSKQSLLSRMFRRST